MAELSAYRLASDLVLFFERCDASSISAERQGVIFSKFGYMPDAILREEAKETEARRIEKIPAHENLPGAGSRSVKSFQITLQGVSIAMRHREPRERLCLIRRASHVFQL